MGELGTTRRRSRGKRQARDGAPGQNPHLERPYITRNIPTYDILGDEALERIEATADRIMAEIGIEFRDDPDTVDMFRKAGGEVTQLDDTRWNIKFAPGMIREILRAAPGVFTQHARNPANNVQIGGDNLVFAPSLWQPLRDGSGQGPPLWHA